MSPRARILWVIPFLMLLHNLEEAFAIRLEWTGVRAAYRELGIGFGRRPIQFDVALAIVTVMSFIVIGWAASRSDDKKRLWAALLVQSVMLLNVFPHVVAAVFVMRGYSPGLVTALALNLPFSIWILRRANDERWVTKRAMWILLPAAIIVHGPLLLMLLLAIAAMSPPPPII